MRNTAICPNCGAEQRGLDLKETKGFVVCYECETKFQVDIEELNVQASKKEEETE